NDMTNLIKQSLKKFKVQEKKPSQTQDPKNPQENVINNNKNDDNSNINITKINLNENQNPSANNFNTVTQIFTGDQRIPITNDNSNNKSNVSKEKPLQKQDPKNPQENVINNNKNNDNSNIIKNNSETNQISDHPKSQASVTSNNKNNDSNVINSNDIIRINSNVPPKNKKTRIGLGVIGLIFIIAGICLLFIAPKIAIISLVIGGLLFIGAIGFNKFRSCLCFNKSQIENSEFEQKQSIDERKDDLQAEQMPGNNEINNGAPLI
ncbi:MAG: DUF308 domain-containing protein, partial [Firmicutes bacterium]|nr:DUF308 domain-containing protein [Bacillota bacterium]